MEPPKKKWARCEWHGRSKGGDPDSKSSACDSPVRQRRTRYSVVMTNLKKPIHLVWDDRLPEDDRRVVGDLNTSLERLSGLRAVEITVSGKFLRSKIAWKLAIYQHVLLHQIVALMDGTAVAWNSRCTLSCMLSARAFMETFAVMAEFERKVTRLLK